ncbi:OadG family protein [Litchfieldella xinjiangensis]|uniref:OadG family protein n=1 Tax=Litchfieldella xinjiangensis TaxID=1166948 RepID=UPI0005B84AF0|nr:OadG family transporter subunit [Halomonas xinjiangensis]
MDTELLQEGVNLMAFGMGFVFVFLTVLVIVTGIMSKVVGRLVPEPAKSEDARPGRTPSPARDDDDVMVVIAAALHRYRQRRRR